MIFVHPAGAMGLSEREKQHRKDHKPPPSLDFFKVILLWDIYIYILDGRMINTVLLY